MGAHCLNKHPDAASELRELETITTDSDFFKQYPQHPCSWHASEIAHNWFETNTPYFKFTSGVALH
jgi:hypothetical protein